MKKLLITIPFLLLAASCNKQSAQVQPVLPNASQGGVVQNQPVQQQAMEAQIKTAVETELNSSTTPQGSRLISVKVEGNKITLDYSKEIESKGQGIAENAFQRISAAIGNLAPAINNYQILIESQPLNEYLDNRVTSDWKTYTNTQYGFEIQLPSDWQVQKNQTSISLNSSKNWETFIKEEEWVKSGYAKNRPADPQDNLTIGYSDDIVKFAKSVNIKLNSPSLEEFIKLNTGFINPQKISFAGETAYRVNTSGMFDEETIFLQRNNQLYSIKIGSKIGMDAQLSSKILSTFKFTK
jgi:hypothetical protein